MALKKKADTLLAKLNPAERVELADMLYASLPNAYEDFVNRAWECEIGRRLDEYEKGKTKPVSSEKVHAGVRRKLIEIKAQSPSSIFPARGLMSRNRRLGMKSKNPAWANYFELPSN